MKEKNREKNFMSQNLFSSKNRKFEKMLCVESVDVVEGVLQETGGVRFLENLILRRPKEDGKSTILFSTKNLPTCMHHPPSNP